MSKATTNVDDARHARPPTVKIPYDLMSRNAPNSSLNTAQEGLLYGSGLQKGHIRLLQLLPSMARTSKITCRLFEVQFSEAPAYEALSYMWGDSDHEMIIVINGIQVSVRRNLCDALWHLRETEKILWIDAICIDQENFGERNHQVQMMGEIYRSASMVLVWIGVASKNSDMALRCIGKYDSHDQSEREDARAFLSNPVGAHATKLLLQRPYWSRLWIIQEVILSRKAMIHCGTTSVSWDSLRTFCWGSLFANLNLYPDLEESSAMALVKTSRSFRGAKKPGLWDLIDKHGRAECSEIRDKIYGLLGIADEGADFLIDYEIPLWDLWARVVALSPQSRWKEHFDFARRLQILLGCNTQHGLLNGPSVSKKLIAGDGRVIGKIVSLSSLNSDGLTASRSSLAFDKVTPIISTHSYGHLAQSVNDDGASSRIFDYQGNLSRERQDKSHLRFIDSEGNAGIAPSNAIIGDVLFGLRGQMSDITGVVRWVEDRFRMVGRVAYAVSDFKKYIEVLASSKIPITLQVDMRSLQLLTR